MYAYQDSHVKNIVRSFKKNQLVMDESLPGSGKTHTSKKVAQLLGLDAIIISGKNVLYHWIQVFKNGDKVNFDVVNYEALKSGYMYKSKDGQTESFEKVKKGEWRTDALYIIDEIHMCKNDTGNRTILNALIDNGVKILGLSATLTDKKPFIKIPYKSYKMKYDPIFKNEIVFLNTYLDAKQPNFNFKGVERLEIKKVDLYIKYFNDNPGFSTIMFTNYNRTINLLKEGLSKHNPLVVNGNFSEIENAVTISKFQKNGGLLLINSMSGGNSINLQDLNGDKPRLVIANIVWSGTLFKQLLYRTYRVNSKSDVKQIILVTEDPIDQYMCTLLMKKLSILGGIEC